MGSELSPIFQYSFESPHRQRFSLPFDVITYLMDSCTSPSVFRKLLQTCKYFFLKKKVILVGAKTWFWNSGGCYCQNHETRSRSFDVNLSFKYWVTDTLYLLNECATGYIYRANLKQLVINEGNLSFEDICLLLNGGEILRFSFYGSIKYADGTPVSLATILEKCPKVWHLVYGNQAEVITSKTFSDLAKMRFYNKYFSKFWLYIYQYPSEIDPKVVVEFLKGHASKYTDIRFCFRCEILPNGFNKFQTHLRQNLGDEFSKLDIIPRIP